MKILPEFCQDVTDTQMSHVAPVILPELYKVFIGAEVCVMWAYNTVCSIPKLLRYSVSVGSVWFCFVVVFFFLFFFLLITK